MKLQGDDIGAQLIDEYRRRTGVGEDAVALPPPCFASMGAVWTSFDAEKATLGAQFPVKEEYLNPYRTMQGGFIVAAADNVIGFLSMMVGPPSVTRTLETRYLRPVLPAMGFVGVTAWFLDREGRRLTFAADVRSPEGTRLASVSAVHAVVSIAGT